MLRARTTHGIRLRSAELQLGLVVLAGVLVAAAPPDTLVPVDQATRQPDFFTFRSQLQRAIARRDVAAVLAAVDPDIRISFGDQNGLAAFRENLEAPGGEVWEDLAAVLSLGGRFEGNDTFVAPYVYSDWPEGIDSFEHVAVIGSHVRLRSAPHADAEPVGIVSFAILKWQGTPHAGWAKVVAPDGREAYISERFVRSPVDYRAFFGRKGGRWIMQAFVAGD